MSTTADAPTYTAGIRLTVLRDAGGDFTAGGITASHTAVTVVGIDRDGEVEVLADGWDEIVALRLQGHAFEHLAPLVPVAEDAPAVVLVVDDKYGKEWRNVFLRPAGARGVAMMGGNFAHASSPNWAYILRRLGLPRMCDAVRVHDRVA